jgi:serine/threonine-protein kinase
MATVFLARLAGVAGFQRMYAIKRLHPHLAKEGEFVDMFLDEARLAARIHHPNVVSILEVGTSEHGYYLVMEYIEGDTAARLIARGIQGGVTFPPGAAVRIGLDTLAGLHAAHELADDDGHPLHIVHRDVSPQNILVGIDGTSRITDFGVAHAATRLSSTRTGQLKGKLAYMAPEQTRGATVDRRSDVFAMGVVIWEMLAGKRLFKGSNDAETLHRILFAPIPTLRGAGVDVPIPLETVCMRALAREPEERYASAADFADELERVARSLGMLATTRDIASYVDASIGAEISQQREVVRSWLSRSEPSRSARPKASVAGDPVGLAPASGGPRGVVSSRDVTLLAAAEDGRVPPKGTDVSSVSSAVLEMPEATTTDSKVLFPGGSTPLIAAPKGRRPVLWGALAACGLALAVAAGFALPHGSPPSLAPATGGPPGASAVPVAAAAPAVEAASVPSTGASPSAVPLGLTPASGGPVVPTGAAVASARAVVPGRTSRPATVSPAKPTGRSGRGPTTSDDLPDDLSRNPYR